MKGNDKTKRINVSSSNIKSIGYDSDNMILEVEFNNLTIYQFFNVPNSVYNNLMNAQSHGKYFASNIKNNYKYIKIN